jgi:hypothetical protein
MSRQVEGNYSLIPFKCAIIPTKPMRIHPIMVKFMVDLHSSITFAGRCSHNNKNNTKLLAIATQIIATTTSPDKLFLPNSIPSLNKISSNTVDPLPLFNLSFFSEEYRSLYMDKSPKNIKLINQNNDIG